MIKPYAMVTGASRGIGREVAKLLAKQGFPLILIAHNRKEALEETAAACLSILEQTGCPLPLHPVLHFLCDLSDADAVDALFQTLREKGIGKEDAHLHTIGVLVNNAGIAHFDLVQDMTADVWHHVLATNLDSVFFTCRAVVPMMVKKQQGVIVNVSSYWGQKGAAMESAYAASKGGVTAFSLSLAEELAPSGIRVHVVSPEFVDTEMNAHLTKEERNEAVASMPSQHVWTPEEIAEEILSCI